MNRDSKTNDSVGGGDAKPYVAPRLTRYVAPRLERYGDLKSITAKVGVTGVADGGSGKNMTQTGV